MLQNPENNMKYLSLTFFILFLQSCKKENYTELIKENGTTTKANYKKGRLVSSEIYNNSGKLDSKYLYSNGIVVEIYQYYPNQKVNSYSYLHKAPNHYTTKVYYKSGKISNEGEGDFFKNKALYLRRGPWVFYSKTGEPYAVYTFIHDSKNQYIKGEMLFDTIKKKILRDVIFDPPILPEKETAEVVHLFHPK